MVAAVGGFGSLFGALVAPRQRGGSGRAARHRLAADGRVGNLFIPLAPAGMPLMAIAFLIGQQLVGDPRVTVYDITEMSMRQSSVGDRQLAG